MMTVLLAAYQGAAFLPAQLASLAGQLGVDWRLLWRDDGSTDATVAVLEGFAAAHPGRVRRLPGPGRLGATEGFLALLDAAPPEIPCAFMDQDDVWLPGKLERALGRLRGAEASCGRLELVDAELNHLAFSPLPRVAPGFASLLAHNVAAGCTMALSPRGRALALAMPPPPGTAHDWWAALLVTGQGGRLDYDGQPMIRYRQHGGNAVGGGAGLAARIGRALRRGRPEGLVRLPGHLAALRGVALTEGARAACTLLEGLPMAGPLRRLRLARQAGFRHHAPLGQAWLSLALLSAAPAGPAPG